MADPRYVALDRALHLLTRMAPALRRGDAEGLREAEGLRRHAADACRVGLGFRAGEEGRSLGAEERAALREGLARCSVEVDTDGRIL